MVSTVTLYRSPVRLVKHASEEAEPYSSQAISRARKKIMAEIALGGDELVVEDVPYSRNDAATLLDVITEDRWKAHTIIYNHKGLLHFLEQEEFDAAELRKADAYLYNSTFVQAVSPYFAHSFNSASGKLLRQGDYEQLLQLLDFQGYILPEHSSEGYQKIRTYVDETNYTLRNLSWEKFIADESVLHFVFSDNWKRFINKLPSSFTSLRDELVEQMTGIVLRFQHKATWHYLHQVLVQLKAIETNEFNHAEVVRIDEVIYKNSRIEGGKGSKAPSGSKGEFSSGRIVWWVIWLILAVVRMATCSTHNNRSDIIRNYGYERPPEEITNLFEKQNERRLITFFDSLCSAPSFAGRQQPILTGDQPFYGWAENPGVARNDSAFVVNQSGHDAILLYCKDIPGHAFSSILPKIYATYIKKNESLTMYLQPGNGRLYIAFGDGWAELKEPLPIPLNTEVTTLATSSDIKETLQLTHFFKTTIRDQQTLLMQPITIGHSRSGEETLSVKSPKRIKITLTKDDDGFAFTSNSTPNDHLVLQ